MEKLPKFIILAVLVVGAAGTIFVVASRGKKPQVPGASQVPVSYSPKVANANGPVETVAIAPDGKLTLTMREEKGKDAATFVFLISEKLSSAQKEIYRVAAPAGSITIPFNTFSPDDKYIFLKRSEGGKDSYFVLSTAGSALTKDSQFMEFSNSFESAYPDYDIESATGWGGLSLIVINTKKVSGGEGPSFWVDVPSGKFIQLSSRVN